MSQTVLVLGARGFLGEHVVQQLADAGHDVLAAVRPGAAHGFTPPRVAVLEGDLADGAFVRAALDRAGAVVFSAGRTWQPGLHPGEYERQNVAITQTFFDALGDRPGVRVVFTSSLSAVGGSREPCVYAEDTGRDGIRADRLTPYDRAKLACEEIALRSARRGNRVVVLNPGLLLGPGAFATSNLAAPYYLLWFCQGQFAARFYVNGGVTLCDVRDAARAHVAALDRGRSGERYILGGLSIDRREFFALVARLTGLRPPRALPAWFLYGLTAAADALAFLSRGRVPSPVHRSFARAQGLYYYGASAKAAAELGYSPRPIEATLLDMLHYYQERGLLPEPLDHLKGATAETARAFVLLKQLAAASGYGSFLNKRLPALYETCQANHALREAFQRLLVGGTFDDRRGRFGWDRAGSRADARTLQRFFEYVYFSSDEFLQKAL
jgi:dihydroflavonol-4-reductase